jgi:hypothetical protein
MGKKIATLRALISGDALIEYTKTPIKRTPGDTTECGHQ